VNSVIRKATNARKIFPNDQSARKVVYLAIENASKKWTMPLRDWKTAINQFMIMYQDRMPNFNKAVYTDLFTLSYLNIINLDSL